VADRRLTLWPYLGLWALLLVAQGGVAVSWLLTSPGLALGLLVVLQLLKVPVAAARLNDLGHPGDDALLALVPLANIGLWQRLNRGTPAEAQRRAVRARWIDELTATQTYLRGLRGLGRSAPTVIPLGIVAGSVYAAGETWLVNGLLAAQGLERGQRVMLDQGLLVAVVLVGLYTFVQILKRRTASRASWLPTFLFLPLLLAWVVSQVGGTAAHADPNAGMVRVIVGSTAWAVLWSCIGGAALGVLWVSTAEAQSEGRSLGFGEAISRIGRRTADVAAPHGAAALAIMVGMQVVIPGIIYTLQFSFVDAAAVWHRRVPALKRSTRLTRGIRRRVFKVWVYGFIAALLMSWVAALPVEWWVHRADMSFVEVVGLVLRGVPTLLAVAPPQLTQLSAVTVGVVWAATGLGWGAARVGLAHLYAQRLERDEARRGEEASASAAR